MIIATLFGHGTYVNMDARFNAKHFNAIVKEFVSTRIRKTKCRSFSAMLNGNNNVQNRKRIGLKTYKCTAIIL